jgi:hemerythrin superfamily protein
MTTQNVKNPIEFFAKDHREIERLIKEIQRENEVETRASMVRELIRSVVFHTTAEESQLYPLVQSLLPDGNKLVDESVEGHVALETSLSELENTHPRDVKFLPKVNEVYQIFKAHSTKEDSVIFPELQKKLSQAQLNEIYDRIMKTSSHTQFSLSSHNVL